MFIHHWISLDILSDITGTSVKKLKKEYEQVTENNCVPLFCIEQEYQDTYVQEYLYRDKIIDFPFLAVVNKKEVPLHAKNVQHLFNEMTMMRQGEEIHNMYHSNGTVTKQLKKFCKKNGISYSTYCRRRKQYMHANALTKVLNHGLHTEETKDSYRTCCMYCRDLIIFLHEKPGKISASKIHRDILKMKPFSCLKCPYHSTNKENNDKVPFAACKRKTETMIRPEHVDVVRTIIRRIPEQMDVLAWNGVRAWANTYHFTPSRKKPEKVNEVWFSDHKILDIFVKVYENGKWTYKRPWITAIIDAASSVMVSYVLSLQPNSDCIAECFARACAFTVDTPYCGIPDYFYIDNGKDYRSKKMNGLPNNEQPLLLNKNFGESGILEWFGIKVLHALPYKGCSKSIESIWGTIDDEWIRELPGYCGSKPDERPEALKQELKQDNIYTFEQFADYFAENIYPAYNSFSVTKESPDSLYQRLEKTSSYVPTWATLSVLKSVSEERVIRNKGIQYNNAWYWCSALGPLVEKNRNTKYRIFAFDTPFNRNISVVDENSHYIGEAHLIEKLNVVEKKRYKVIQHVQEQQKQHRFYSNKLKQLHDVILASDILDEVTAYPAVDHIRYGQAIDESKDKQLPIDTDIPLELQQKAIEDNLSVVTKQEEGSLTRLMKQIGKESRKK